MKSVYYWSPFLTHVATISAVIESAKSLKKYSKKMLKNTDIKVIGLRLFTIYGEWGRPDMLILKFLKLAKQKKMR